MTPLPLGDRWDPPELKTDDERRAFEPTDLGWIGEDADGVWVRRHPEALFLEHPDLWEPVTAFRHGQIELTPEDYRSLSNVHYEARLTMLLAHRREEKRQLERDAGGET